MTFWKWTVAVPSVGGASLAVPGLAWADPSHGERVSASLASTTGWSALLLVSVVVALAAWRPPALRWIGRGALIVVLAAFVYADGLHSVHHLPDQSRATPCAAAAVTSHAAATPVAVVVCDPPVLRAAGAPAPLRVPASAALLPREEQGRSPPVIPL